MIFLDKKNLNAYCYYQSAIYSIEIKDGKESNKNRDKVIDVATDDGLIIFIT